MRYRVESREEGRGPATVRTFQTLAELQTYVRDRWQGVEYIDSPDFFHGDYATFEIFGAVLRDLGDHGGPWGTQEYWEWTWKDLTNAAEPASDAPTV